MRRLLCCLAFCSVALAGGEGDGLPLQALPKGWRFRDLGQCGSGAKGHLPCAISEDSGKVVIAFPEAGTGRLRLCMNRYPRMRWFDEPVSCDEYWDTTTLADEPMAFVDAALGEDAVVVWIPHAKRYDPRWTESGGAPGRWHSSFGDQEAPCMPSFPAVALTRTKDGAIFAVHNNPKAKALDYMAYPTGVSPPAAIPVAIKEEVVALAAGRDGTIHALTFFDRDLSYLTNAGGEPKREVLETGELADIRGAMVVDSAGAVHVAYGDARTGGVLYRTNVSGKWTSLLLDRGADVGLACAIVVDVKGQRHVLYTSGAGIRYMTSAAGSWETFSVASGAPLPGCDITVDEQGYVHMCYALDGRMVYATNRPEEGKAKSK